MNDSTKSPPATEQETVRKKPLEEQGGVAAKDAAVPQMAIPVISPCRWWRDEYDAKEGVWYLVIGEDGKETSIIPAFHAHSDFPNRPTSKAIIEAINAFDELKSRVAHLQAVCLAYDKIINTLTGDDLVRFANAIPKEYRAFVSLLAGRGPTLEPTGAKSASVSGSSQTLVEPSGRNALNLQMVRDLLRKGSTAAISDMESRNHNAPAMLRIICEALDLLEKCLSSHAPESSSGSEFPKSASLSAALEALRNGYTDQAEQILSGLIAVSPSSPLPEGEEDSAPAAQPQSDRTKNATGQATSI